MIQDQEFQVKVNNDALTKLSGKLGWSSYIIALLVWEKYSKSDMENCFQPSNVLKIEI